MFKVVENPIVTWPVKITHQVDGKDVEGSFNVTFELLSDEDNDKLTDEDPSMRSLVQRVVKGWDEQLVDGDGKPIPFTTEALLKFIGIGFRRMALVGAYQRAGLGVREKN
jgi:hypothetical protein